MSARTRVDCGDDDFGIYRCQSDVDVQPLRVLREGIESLGSWKRHEQFVLLACVATEQRKLKTRISPAQPNKNAASPGVV